MSEVPRWMEEVGLRAGPEAFEALGGEEAASAERNGSSDGECVRVAWLVHPKDRTSAPHHSASQRSDQKIVRPASSVATSAKYVGEMGIYIYLYIYIDIYVYMCVCA